MRVDLPVFHSVTDTDAGRQGSQEIEKLRIVHLGIRGPRNCMRRALMKRNEVTFITHTSATDGVFDPEAHNKVLDALTAATRIIDPGWMDVGMKQAIAVCV